MNSDLAKKESFPLLDFIESLGETEWRRCINSQYSVKEYGVWVIRDQSAHPPRVSFRFKQENPEIIARLRSAVESYKGKVKWILDEHKREGFPGTNWTIGPIRLWEVWECARKLDMAPSQYLAEYEPEFGPIAYEDIAGLTEHIRQAFSRG